MKRTLVMFGTLIAVLILLAVLLWSYVFSEHSTCLDMGGRWDEDSLACEIAANPGDLPPKQQCQHYGGEWDDEVGRCIGAEGDPWEPPMQGENTD